LFGKVTRAEKTASLNLDGFNMLGPAQDDSESDTDDFDDCAVGLYSAFKRETWASNNLCSALNVSLSAGRTGPPLPLSLLGDLERATRSVAESGYTPCGAVHVKYADKTSLLFAPGNCLMMHDNSVVQLMLPTVKGRGPLQKLKFIVDVLEPADVNSLNHPEAPIPEEVFDKVTDALKDCFEVATLLNAPLLGMTVDQIRAYVMLNARLSDADVAFFDKGPFAGPRGRIWSSFKKYAFSIYDKAYKERVDGFMLAFNTSLVDMGDVTAANLSQMLAGLKEERNLFLLKQSKCFGLQKDDTLSDIQNHQNKLLAAVYNALAIYLENRESPLALARCGQRPRIPNFGRFWGL
jgi:hypothetical protein